MLWPGSGIPACNSGPADAHASSLKAKVKIGWVGHVFGERPPSGLSVTEAVSVATNNFGNLVWAYSAWKLVDPNATELVPLIAPPFSTPVDAVLLPTANMLVNSSKYKDVEDYTRILVNIVNGISPQTAPIMLIAIGSQVEFEETPGDPSSIEAAAATAAIEAVRVLALVQLHVVTQRFICAVPLLPLGFARVGARNESAWQLGRKLGHSRASIQDGKKLGQVVVEVLHPP
jgi:hypothetical protein